MSLIVKLNTRVASHVGGTIQQDNASFWDPLTKTNLNRSNPNSADLAAFSGPQLANIRAGLDYGTLAIVSNTTGNLASATAGTYNAYGNFASDYASNNRTGPGVGVTGVSAGTP